MGAHPVVLVVAHLLSPFSQLEDLTCGVWITTYVTKSFSLPKLGTRNSSSPFEVRHALLGGQREHTPCNPQNEHTFPSRSQGGGSHSAKHTQLCLSWPAPCPEEIK